MNPSHQLSGRRSQGHPRWKRHSGDASTGTSQGHISKEFHICHRIVTMVWKLCVAMVMLGLVDLGGAQNNANSSLTNRDWRAKRDDNWYLFAKEELSWHQASKNCSDQGGHLVEIGSANEQQYLEIMLRQIPEEHEHWWIGLSDLDREGSFVWEGTGRPGYFQNWHPSQPNNYNQEQDCVEWVQGGWNDANCEQQYRYICEL